MSSEGPSTSGTQQRGASAGTARPHANGTAGADGPQRLAQLDQFAEEVGRRSRRLLLGHGGVTPSAPAPADATRTGGGDGVRA